MVRHYLEFEKPIVELEDEIGHLKRFSRDKQIHFSEKLKGLEEKLQRLQKEIYSTLSAWQITQLARHIDRPKASHYLRRMFESFVELHGDRFGDDPAIVGGLCKFNGRSVVVIAHQKETMREMVQRNLGCPSEDIEKPKADAVSRTVWKPILTMIDTLRAYPGVGAEEGSGRSDRKTSRV
jgi:acetyl-CoA carboxylase carboxyl transferase subunit alpha